MNYGLPYVDKRKSKQNWGSILFAYGGDEGGVRSFTTEQRLLPRANRVSPGVRKGARPFGAQPVPRRHKKTERLSRSVLVVEMRGVEPLTS